MVTVEDRVVAILTRADPAPQDRNLERPHTAAGYLATLDTRSREMQTIETEQDTGAEKRPPNWGWFALAAAMVAVVATVGIILTNGNEEAPIATTPQVEEEEPVPTTEPVPSTEPEAAPESTVPTTRPEPEELVGVTGLPIYNGQTEAGEYEVVTENVHFVFSHDGDWEHAAIASESQCQDTRSCELLGGAFSIRSTRAVGDRAVIDYTFATAEQMRDRYAEIPNLAVSDLEPLNPTHPDATWTGMVFTVRPTEGAPMHPFCKQYEADYSCVVIEWFEERYEGVRQAIHGPTKVFILERPNGSRFFATNAWHPAPLPPPGDHEVADAHLRSLLESIRFVD